MRHFFVGQQYILLSDKNGFGEVNIDNGFDALFKVIRDIPAIRCERCNKVVDSVRVATDHGANSIVFTAYCHGESETNRFDRVEADHGSKIDWTGATAFRTDKLLEAPNDTLAQTLGYAAIDP